LHQTVVLVVDFIDTRGAVLKQRKVIFLGGHHDPSKPKWGTNLGNNMTNTDGETKRGTPAIKN
jgi:hypothetical protein